MLKDSLKRNKVRIFIIAALMLSAVNIYCYKAHFEDHMKLRDYKISEQLLYNPGFVQEEYAPDALIREIVRDKKVLVPRELRPYKEYWSYDIMHEEGNFFSAEYFWENNYTKYFSEYSLGVSVDTSLPDLYELQDRPLTDQIKSDFTYLGPGNDMMRYVHVADHTDEETSNQFFYTWYYTTYPEHPIEEALRINICEEGISDDDVLVALWDTGENLYLMGRTYYMENVAAEYQDTSEISGAEPGIRIADTGIIAEAVK